jgi:hypothetical protein
MTARQSACSRTRSRCTAREQRRTKLARTQLAYGERLRRQRRRLEARRQLRNALNTFEGLGHDRVVGACPRGANATGETARRRDTSAIHQLTPQELRVAELVARGATNATRPRSSS